MLSGFPGKNVLLGAVLAVSGGVWAQEGVVSATPEDAGGKIPAAATPMEQVGVSEVRIVRLSEVRGAVQMDRQTGRGFESAFANIPVVARARLRTEQGLAEVEFEDNSSMRLAPGTEVRFERLSRTATGAPLTTVEVVKGMVYVSLEKSKGGGEFALTDGTARVEVAPGADLRLDATGPEAQLAVFDGVAALQLGGTTTAVVKRHTVALNPGAGTVSTATNGTEERMFDGWDKRERDYHNVAKGFAGGSGLYGANDLNYYGSFSNVAGCGTMWRPYFASAGWDPFANGTWALYPGAGYSWVSPYPWGWLPFHSGAWSMCGGNGWGWQPAAGTWYGLNNAVAMRIAKYPLPHPVPNLPGRNASTLVPVNTRPLTVSGGKGAAQEFTFRGDSAGMGVPRSTFGSLQGVSATVGRHGVATTAIAAPSGPSTVSAAGMTTSLAPGLPGRSMSSASATGMTHTVTMSAPASGSAGGGAHK